MHILILLGKIALAALPLLAFLKIFNVKKPSVKGRIIEGEIVEESKRSSNSS